MRNSQKTNGATTPDVIFFLVQIIRLIDNGGFQIWRFEVGFTFRFVTDSEVDSGL